MRAPDTATERARQAYRLPGLSLRAAAFVVEVALRHFPDGDKPTGRPRALSVVQAVRLALCRWRRTATSQDLHADVGIGVTTAGDYHQVMVVFLADLLGAADEDGLSALVAGKGCLVEGTLIPTFTWRHRTDLASGKHRRYGVNVAAAGRSPRPAPRRQPGLSRKLARGALLPARRLGQPAAAVRRRKRRPGV